MSGDMCPWIDDYAEVWSETTRRARKCHRCHECGGDILPGETYQHVSSLFDGRWSTTRACAICVAGPLGWVRHHCGSYVLGGLFEHLGEVFENRGMPPGVRMKVGRWIVEARRRNAARRARRLRETAAA